MKIRYKHQRFQAEATKCVSDVFQGQPKHDGSRTFLNKIDMWDFDGFGNLPLVLDNERPLRVLFRDACFKEDAQKINIYEQFKQALDWVDDEAFKSIRVI